MRVLVYTASAKIIRVDAISFERGTTAVCVKKRDELRTTNALRDILGGFKSNAAALIHKI